MFKNPFSFEGRIRRTEFGLSFIIYIIISIFNVIAQSSGGSPIFIFLLIPLLWFLWVQGAKRCHDLGNSGWFQIIPFYGFWMLFADGKKGENIYGPNPKGIN